MCRVRGSYIYARALPRFARQKEESRGARVGGVEYQRAAKDFCRGRLARARGISRAEPPPRVAVTTSALAAPSLGPYTINSGQDTASLADRSAPPRVNIHRAILSD